MNAEKLLEFLKGRKPSPHVARKDLAGLTCYGCAHSAAMAPPPGQPSGERPCCSCVRNPEREAWAKEAVRRARAAYERRETVGEFVSNSPLRVGNDGHARIFDPFLGTMYNGAPRLYDPMDNYVTLDQRDQEDWLREHPEYAGAVDGNGDPVPDRS